MGKVKKCSECLAEIPKEAKKCQHCGSKQKGRIGIVGGTFIVLLVIMSLPMLTSLIFGTDGEGTSVSDQDKKLTAAIKKNKELRAKSVVDEFSQGRDAIISRINSLINEGKKSDALKEVKRFLNAGVKDDELMRVSFKLQSELKKEREAKEAERIRQAYLNDTGVWSNSYFVDDFGDRTNDPYITNKVYFTGFFSNSATQDSKLNIKFLIPKRAEISVQLYEYAGRNPVKSYGSSINHTYSILVKDKEGKKHKFSATNWSERLTFDSGDSKKLHSILMRGGKVAFNIVNNETRSSQYNFVINNASGYDSAYRKLKEAYKQKK